MCRHATHYICPCSCSSCSCLSSHPLNKWTHLLHTAIRPSRPIQIQLASSLISFPFLFYMDRKHLHLWIYIRIHKTYTKLRKKLILEFYILLYPVQILHILQCVCKVQSAVIEFVVPSISNPLLYNFFEIMVENYCHG